MDATVSRAGAEPTIPSIDGAAWLERWDAQQTAYLPRREARFQAMLDALEALLPEDFTAIDLACGPGSLSQRLLARFPRARAVAVDLDPALLALGKRALGDMGGRLRWVDANLMDVDLPSALGLPRVDAVLSTTALHWLPAERLAGLYQQLGRLIRPKGVFLNGDNIPFARHLPALEALAKRARQREERDAFEQRGAEDWDRWWKAIGAEPGMAALIAERARRFAGIRRDWPEPLLDFHLAALSDAGFQEVGVIWQHLDDRVVLALR